jgi:5'-nucleotidase
MAPHRAFFILAGAVMIRLQHRSALILAAGLALAACAHHEAENAPQPLDVRVIAFNDFHGYIDAPGELLKIPGKDGGSVSLSLGAAATLAGAIQSLKTGHPRSVVVAAGDLVGASPLDSGLFHDEPTIEALNQMGLEISSVGNHEFDQGKAELLRKQNGGCFPGDGRGGGVRGQDTCADGDFAGARFHYLAANVIDQASGKTLFPPYQIKSFDDGHGGQLPIAFIGLVLKGTPAIVAPAGVAGLSFADEADTANALLPELRAKGVKAYIILIHQGGQIDGTYNDQTCPGLRGEILGIADRLDPAFGVIVSAHTHRTYNCRYQGRLLTSAGSYGRFLTAIDLRLDPGSGAIVSDQAENIPVVNGQQGAAPDHPPFPADPQVAALVARYDALTAPITGRIVGSVTGDITRAPQSGGESALGELVADSALAATRGQGAIAAFVNAGGVRADLIAAQISSGEQPGQITYGEAYQVLPFGNRLVTVSLTGDQLGAVLAQQWSAKGANLLQVAGLSYRWDAAAGQVVPGSLQIDGRPVRGEARYRITTVDFLLGGGDGFTALKAGTDPVPGGLALDAFTAYLAGHSPVAAPATDRVTRTGQ